MLGGRLRVAGEHDGVVDAEVAQALQGVGGVVAHVVGEHDAAGGGAVDGDVDRHLAGLERGDVGGGASVTIHDCLPTCTRWPSTVAVTPLPDDSSTSLAGSRSAVFACAVIARASTCGDDCSAEAA